MKLKNYIMDLQEKNNEVLDSIYAEQEYFKNMTPMKLQTLKMFAELEPEKYEADYQYALHGRWGKNYEEWDEDYE